MRENDEGMSIQRFHEILSGMGVQQVDLPEATAAARQLALSKAFDGS